MGLELSGGQAGTPPGMSDSPVQGGPPPQVLGSPFLQPLLRGGLCATGQGLLMALIQEESSTLGSRFPGPNLENNQFLITHSTSNNPQYQLICSLGIYAWILFLGGGQHSYFLNGISLRLIIKSNLHSMSTHGQ